MDYSKFIDLLYRLIPDHAQVQKKDSSELTCILDTALGNPSKCYPIVHVAGTNGKGSVVSKIAKAYSLDGYKVGVFTSPHLHCIRERIQINEEKISEEEFLSFGEKVFQIVRSTNMKLHFFEMMTCVALGYFAKHHVDLVVFETGIGGRFDSTNFIVPVLSVITSISYDHCHFLGNSLEEIGWQKAGIIKKGVPVVLGPTAQLDIILKEAREKSATVMINNYCSNFFDEENSATAQKALEHLNSILPIKKENIILGLEKRPPCRFEVHSFLDHKGRNIDVVLDVAHNPDGFKKLIESIYLKLGNRTLRFLIGMTKGKEVKSCFEVIVKHASFIHLAKANHFKLFTPKELKDQLISIGFNRCGYEKTLEKTLIKAFEEAKVEEEVLVICGSFYIMSEIKELIKLNF